VGSIASQIGIGQAFTRPYQIHGSIGPSCAVALVENGTTTVWSHTQGVYPDWAAISEMLGMPPEQVRVIHVEGSAATVITEQTTRLRMRRSSLRRCRADRSGSNGCASRSMCGSPMGPQC
jgi:CO/xanthine dehydrogenase Mo-binding subunit